MELYDNPLVIKIHNGTTRSDVDLCVTCRSCEWRVGALTGRKEVYCNTIANAHRPLTEPMAVCSEYDDKTKPSLRTLEEMAWTLNTSESGKTVGFMSPDQINKLEKSRW